jgi:hypothetical protein
MDLFLKGDTKNYNRAIDKNASTIKCFAERLADGITIGCCATISKYRV